MKWINLVAFAPFALFGLAYVLIRYENWKHRADREIEEAVYQEDQERYHAGD
jgi:hypothetical protein